MRRWFANLILRLTHRLWNRRISRILCRMYGDGVINSHQLHELTARFDPTQEWSREVYYDKLRDSDACDALFSRIPPQGGSGTAPAKNQ